MFGWAKKAMGALFGGATKVDPNLVSVDAKEILRLFCDDATLNQHQEQNRNSMDIARDAFDLMKQLSCTYTNSNPSSVNHINFNSGLSALKHALPTNNDGSNSSVTVDRETLEHMKDAQIVVDPALNYLRDMINVAVLHQGPLQDNLMGETYESAYKKLKYFDEKLRSFFSQLNITSYQYKMDIEAHRRMAEEQQREFNPPPRNDFDMF